MILTIEFDTTDHSEVAICFDAEGLNLLLSKLEYLKTHIDHLHLLTPSWAGNELSEDKMGGERYELINSLRIVRVPG